MLQKASSAMLWRNPCKLLGQAQVALFCLGFPGLTKVPVQREGACMWQVWQVALWYVRGQCAQSSQGTSAALCATESPGFPNTQVTGHSCCFPGVAQCQLRVTALCSVDLIQGKGQRNPPLQIACQGWSEPWFGEKLATDSAVWSACGIACH